MNVDKVKKLFPALQKHPKMTFLDSAASSLKLQESIDAVTHYYEDEGCNIGRGTYTIEVVASQAYERTRDVVQRFIHAKTRDSIVFTKGTTQSLNMIASHYEKYLQKGDEVITTELEHHASFLPWQRACNNTGATLIYAPLDKDLRIDEDGLIRLITPKTKVIAITMVSNVMGYITPLEKIIKKAHEVGAIVVCDAAQAAPHIQIDVEALDCDFLAFSGHKCFGPTGVGILYGKLDLLEAMEPLEVGGAMIDDVKHHSYTTQPAPYKFEAGTPPIAQVIGLAPALEFMMTLNHEDVHKHIMDIYKYAVLELSKIEDITIHNPNADVGIITFSLKDIHAHDIQTFMSDADIAIRAGHHCARLLQYKLGVGSTIRASLQIYNKKEDIDALVRVVKEARDFFINY